VASTVGLWILVAIVAVIVVIVLTLPIQTSMKVSLTIALAGYTIYAGTRQIDRQDQAIEFGAIESMWSDIQFTHSRD
jgi:nicotinamide riboside transporter PnuC